MASFLQNRQVGDKGESFTLGYLYGSSPKGAVIQSVSEYHPGAYRWNGRRLPDFLVTEGEKKTLVEVKCKQGFRGKMNICSGQIDDYLFVAREKGYDFYLLFFFMQDGFIYKLSPADLANPTDSFRDKEGKTVLLFDTEGKEKLSQKIPPSIFNSDILKW